MTETSCIPDAVNIEVWKTVAAKLSKYPSLLDALDGDDDTYSDEATNRNSDTKDALESHNETFHGRLTKGKISSSEQLKVYQRRLLTCIIENPADLNHQLPPYADMQVLTTNSSLVVPEDAFQQACLQGMSLEEDHVGWVAQYILLPQVSQLSGPLPHPCQQQLSALVELHPTALTTSCLCPALRWGSPPYIDQLVASLLDQLPTVLMTHGAALLESVGSREPVEESALVVVESAGVALPQTSTPSSSLTAEGVVTTLARLCGALTADNSRVGRVLLRLTHKLRPYLADNGALKRQFAQTVEGHTSPLQRPIKMQLSKIL